MPIVIHFMQVVNVLEIYLPFILVFPEAAAAQQHCSRTIEKMETSILTKKNLM